MKLRLKRSFALCLLSATLVGYLAVSRSLVAQSAPVQQPTQSSTAGSTTPAQSAQGTTSQQSTSPVGTAAAPAVEPEGVPGSRPSGAAIAAGKQKHKRSFAVRTALIIAGVVAVGTVVGLSEASPGHSH